MKIETVAVMGAGAVGSYFLYGLREKLGKKLWVIAEGERKKRLEQDGILLNGERIPLQVKTPMEARGADLLLVTVKYAGLPSVLESLPKIVDEHTIVLSPMNGVDSEGRIGEVVGMKHLLYSMMMIASDRNGGQVDFDPEKTGGIYFGGGGLEGSGEKVRALLELFSGSKLHYTYCEDILRMIWLKYALNISNNLPQAMLGCGIGIYKSSAHALALSQKLREEVLRVANAKGIPITEEEYLAKMSLDEPPQTRYSTLQDLDAGRPTEIDMFSGAMIRMGKELGIPTPYNEFTYHMIKALEEKNDGLFV